LVNVMWGCADRPIPRTAAQIAALLVFAILVYATFSPISFRPRTGYVGVERGAAFGLLTLALAIGFPDQFWLGFSAVITGVIALEIAQNLTRDRHGEILDAFRKAAAQSRGVRSVILSIT
jgi:hypothetical protein